MRTVMTAIVCLTLISAAFAQAPAPSPNASQQPMAAEKPGVAKPTVVIEDKPITALALHAQSRRQCHG